MNSKIPYNWALAELKQLGIVVTGSTPSKKNPQFYGDSIPFYKPTDLDAGYKVVEAREYLSELGASKSRLLPAFSVLVTCIGATIGKTGLSQTICTTNQQINSVIPDTNIFPQWLFWSINSPQGQKLVINNASATTLPILNKTRFSKLKIPLAPLNEQKRIVDKIEALQARSTAVKKELEIIKPLIDQFRQSVLAAAFRGDLTKDWREQNPDVEPAEVLLERIRLERRRRWEEAELEKMKAKDKVPKNDKWKNKYKEPEYSSEVFSSRKLFPIDNLHWTVAHLELLVNPIRGIPYGIIKTGEHTIDGIPTVRCGDIKNYGIDINKLKLVSPKISCNYNRTLLEGNEVLLSIRGTVGSVALATSEMKNMNISREIAMIPTLPGLNRTYAMYLLSSPIGFTILAKHTKGVAHSGINLNDLRSFPVPIPPLKEQKEIVRRIESLFKLADNIEQQYQQATTDLETLNQSILAKAFRGELVPQDPNDEPASVLLEKIKAEREKAKPKKSKTKKKKSNKKQSKQLDIPGI